MDSASRVEFLKELTWDLNCLRLYDRYNAEGVLVPTLHVTSGHGIYSPVDQAASEAVGFVTSTH